MDPSITWRLTHGGMESCTFRTTPDCKDTEEVLACSIALQILLLGFHGQCLIRVGTGLSLACANLRKKHATFDPSNVDPGIKTFPSCGDGLNWLPPKDTIRKRMDSLDTVSILQVATDSGVASDNGRDVYKRVFALLVV